MQDALAAALAAALADRLRPHRLKVAVGVPTLGLSPAVAVARRLGHSRFVALGTSRKFWYDPAPPVPVSSIISPDEEKRLWLDPRMLPVLDGRRIALVHDVASTGVASMRRTAAAALALLAAAGVAPQAAGFAVLQGAGWRAAVGALPVAGAFATPRLVRGADGR